MMVMASVTTVVIVVVLVRYTSGSCEWTEGCPSCWYQLTLGGSGGGGASAAPFLPTGRLPVSATSTAAAAA